MMVPSAGRILSSEEPLNTCLMNKVLHWHPFAVFSVRVNPPGQGVMPLEGWLLSGPEQC